MTPEPLDKWTIALLVLLKLPVAAAVLYSFWIVGRLLVGASD